MSKLTLGPLFFNWDAEKRRDFYFRMADEAAIDVVYIGEVVCSKREVLFASYQEEVVSRLRKAGKEVVYSTLALITTAREMEALRSCCSGEDFLEANDISCVHLLKNKPFVIGPLINVYNEGALDFLWRKGAKRLCAGAEISENGIGRLAASKPGAEIEYIVFGRQPLAMSMRCYSARAHGFHKDGCRFVCGLEPDGMEAATLDGQKLLSVNGTQTLSHGCVVLLDRLRGLQEKGVTHFRLSPQNVDMVEVATLYRSVLDNAVEPAEAMVRLRAMVPMPFINGFSRAREGMAWVE